MDPYRELAAALAGDGIRCYFQSAGQMVVSAQVGLVWPDRGNSFWVAHAGGRWHLFTWSPVGYRVPEGADVARLCRVCMAHGSSAMPTVPAHIAREFGLTELSDEQAEAVYAEMDKHAEPGAADVTMNVNPRLRDDGTVGMVGVAFWARTADGHRLRCLNVNSFIRYCP